MNEIPSDKLHKQIAPEEGSAKRATKFVRSQTFRYYIHDAVASCRLQLIGELTEAEVDELTGCWRTAKTTLGERPLILDLHALRSVDEAGKQWLAGMAQEGAKCSPERYLRDLVAGKHMAGGESLVTPPKQGFLSRLMGLLKSTGVEAAK